MEKPTVILPIVHMNGDTKKTLLHNLESAYQAVKAAEVALAACAPNGRNYYLVDGLFPQALTQFHERMVHLAAVRQSLVAEADGIQQNYPDRPGH